MKTQYINYKVSTASALQGFKQDSDIFRIWFYKDHFFLSRMEDIKQRFQLEIEISGKQKVKDEARWNQRKEVKERMD